MSAIRFQFEWEEGETVPVHGFRFGNCLLCVGKPGDQLLGARMISLPDFPERSLRVAARLVPYEREIQFPHVLAMLLEDREEQFFPDLSTKFSLSAPIGSRVRVNRPDRQVIGEIVDRERSIGNFLYFVVLPTTESSEGSPVFLEDEENLIGIVVARGPGYVTVLGLEPASSPASSGLFSRQENVRRSLRESYRSLLPDNMGDIARRSLRNRVAGMNLFMNENDIQMT